MSGIGRHTWVGRLLAVAMTFALTFATFLGHLVHAGHDHHTGGVDAKRSIHLAAVLHVDRNAEVIDPSPEPPGSGHFSCNDTICCGEIAHFSNVSVNSVLSVQPEEFRPRHATGTGRGSVSLDRPPKKLAHA